MPIRAFRHITKSSSAAGRTRRRLGNTSTCPYVHFDIEQMTLLYVKEHLWTLFLLPSRRLVRPAADDDFVICLTKCLKFCIWSLRLSYKLQTEWKGNYQLSISIIRFFFDMHCFDVFWYLCLLLITSVRHCFVRVNTLR